MKRQRLHSNLPSQRLQVQKSTVGISQRFRQDCIVRRRSVLLPTFLASCCLVKNAAPLAPRLVAREPLVRMQSSVSWSNRRKIVLPTTTTIASPLILEPTSHPAPTDDMTIQERESQSSTELTRKICTRSTAALKQWRHRLVTKEDPKHTHKITGSVFVLSSIGLTWYGIHDFLFDGWTQPVSVHGTPFIGLLCTLVVSSIAQSFSSIHLACHHRQGQPAIRNTFLCNAAVAILGSVSALWSSPWYPEVLNGTYSKAFYVIMDGIGLIGMADNLFRLPSLIASRQSTSTYKYHVDQMSPMHYWMDVFVYLMPILIGAPFFLGIGWQFGIQHDRTFYLNLLHDGQYPHLQAGAVYSMVAVAMGASYSSLVVTLRDKKLIGKSTEGVSLTIIMLCLIGSLYQALRDPGVIVALLGM